jgi:hypothetical protein
METKTVFIFGRSTKKKGSQFLRRSKLAPWKEGKVYLSYLQTKLRFIYILCKSDHMTIHLSLILTIHSSISTSNIQTYCCTPLIGVRKDKALCYSCLCLCRQGKPGFKMVLVIEQEDTHMYFFKSKQILKLPDF